MPSNLPKCDSLIRLVKRRTLGRSTWVRLCSVRPSLLDTRFRGDAWIVPQDDGLTSLYLDNSCLVHLQLLPFDVPSLNGALQQMRWCRTCHRLPR
jgi:hypothetical protein